jgi:aryl-alcohol dehydrogenase-like predicted oxidoreductase
MRYTKLGSTGLDVSVICLGRMGLADPDASLGRKPAQVALAWMLGKEAATAPIVGATRAQHLTDAVAAVELELDPEDVAYLEQPHRPHAVVGHF